MVKVIVHKKLFEKLKGFGLRKAASILVLCILVVGTGVTYYELQQLQDIRQRAAENEAVKDTAFNPPSSSSFLSNSILIKVKQSSRGKVKEDPASTGITSLNGVKLKGFEKIAVTGKNAKTDADLFSWYLVTLDEPEEKVIGKLDQVTGRLTLGQNSQGKANHGYSTALLQLNQVIDKLSQDPDIETVDLNYIVEAFVAPNDPYYSSMGSWGQAYDDLWGMKKMNMSSAWDLTTGSTSIIVAGIDTGVDRNHPDIAANIWVNSAETPNNNVDDDGNGYIDDYYGCNFINMAGNKCADPMDDHGHGSHTVGTIAGVGNNAIGVVGVNWTSKIMALKFLDSSGSGYLSDGIKALQYAADMGARVSSNSWGGGGTSQVMDDAVKYEHDRGMVTVFAAGNSNTDALDFNPASADYAITVAASDSNDLKASFSNYGEKIDVTAPGVDILSIRASSNPMCTAARTVGTNYCRVSGTSMATPHVAGLAALLLSKNPNLTNEEVRQIIRTGADDLAPAGKDSSFGFGRINAFTTLNLSDSHPLTPVITSPSSRSILTASSISITGGVGGVNFGSYILEYGVGRSPSTWIEIANSTTQVTNGVLGTLNAANLSDGTYTIRLKALDTTGKSYQFQVFDLIADNFDLSIDWPRTATKPGTVNILGTAVTKNGMPFSSYKIEWSRDETLWSTTGVTLANGGTQPVTSGTLGTWDTSSLTHNNQYFLRLTITSTTNASTSVQPRVLIDNDLVSGWPKAIHRDPSCYYYYCQAATTVADLDGNGVKEILVTSPDNKLYAFNKNGSNYPGFPISVTTGELFIWPVSVDDLDNDGKPEIIAVTLLHSGYLPCGNCVKMYIFKNDGSQYPGWTPPIFIEDQYMPTTGDLDGDGVKEIILVDTYYQKIHAYHLNNTEAVGFPKTITAPVTGYGTNASVVDIDQDGRKEIAFGLWNSIYVYGNTGELKWSYTVPPCSDGTMANFVAPPAIGDMNGDGSMELYITNYRSNCGVVGTRIFGLDKNGAPLPNWPMTASQMLNYSLPQQAPSLVDIDNDGKDELISGLYNTQIFTATGIKASNNTVYSQGNPSVADADGDGKIEYTTAYLNSIAIFNDDATTYWRRILPADSPELRPGDTAGRGFSSSSLFSDLDNDGQMELTVGEDRGFFNGDPLVYLWEVPKAGAGLAKYEWPMFSHDPARTGRLIMGSVPPTPTPVAASPTPTPTTIPTPVPQDKTAPSVSIISPLNGATLATKSTVTISASATDNVGVARVEFSVGNILACTDTTAPYSCSWKVPNAKNKTYTLTAKAYDAAGNTGLSSVTVSAK